MRGRVDDFFEAGTDRFGEQLQAGQVTYRGREMGGVGALRGALAHQASLLEAGQREAEEPVGTADFGEPVAEVGQHAVTETGIVQRPGPPSRGDGEILVAPQPFEVVTYPYRRRANRDARPCDLRGQRRDMLTGTGVEGQRAPRQLHRSEEPEHAR
ncbi:hypothetical protein [Streptomyces sp. NPDC056296]|uniref:hypothetical protein n=1 Tax=Streptomyces sp. NPDC056296 TaxID=3345775 RepID=UPI0035E33461